MRAWTGAGFPLALLTAISALTLWLKHASELPEEKPVDKARHDPDTIIEQLAASSLDAQGIPLHYLSADRVIRFSDDGSSELTNPRLRFTPPSRPTITISARQGRSLAGRQEIRLFDEVRVEQAGTPEEAGWVATTSELTAYPDQRLARSDKQVRFTQGLATIEGTGFTFDQNARTASLNSMVRGHFPPRSPSRP